MAKPNIGNSSVPVVQLSSQNANAPVAQLIPQNASTLAAPLALYAMHGEKPEKFKGVDFKRW